MQKQPKRKDRGHPERAAGKALCPWTGLLTDYFGVQPPTSLPGGTGIDPSKIFGMSASSVGGAKLKNTPEHSSSPFRWKSA